jgi:hypothetical protein
MTPSPTHVAKQEIIRSQKEPVQWHVRWANRFRVVSQVKGAVGLAEHERVEGTLLGWIGSGPAALLSQTR